MLELPDNPALRVSYRADAPEVLLISAKWEAKEIFVTVRYELLTGRQHLIECDGAAAYKPTLLGRRAIYAERFGEAFEERRLRAARSIRLIGCHLITLRPGDAADGPPR